MKSVIIATMDVLAFLAFGAVLLAGLFLMVEGQFLDAAITVPVGLFACCLVFGAWYVLLDMRKIADKK
jgi:hypothetical protein